MHPGNYLTIDRWKSERLFELSARIMTAIMKRWTEVR